MTEPIQNFSVTRNSDNTLPVSVLTTVPNDTLVGCSVVFCLYPQKFAMITSDTPVVTKSTSDGSITIPVSPPNAMEFDVRLNRADLVPLDYANYYYEATVTDVVGNQVAVICGICTITIGEN